MFRIILIIVLIMLAIPFFNKAKDYVTEESRKVKAVGTIAKKAFHYNEGSKKQ